jgi:small nuclear ribonucleoprotein (snRNP)-like protein
MGVRHVEAFGDYLLVMQQVFGVYQCFDGYLNIYLDKCLEIIAPMILLHRILSKMKIQLRIIWHNKHHVFNQIEETVCSRKIGCSGFSNHMVQLLADAGCQNLFC